MTRERTKELIEAYGADPRRWPAAERADAERLLAEDAGLQAMARDAADLDAMLGSMERVHPPAWLAGRILADGRARTQGGGVSFLKALWPFGGAWQPASALAVALVVGVAAGATGKVQPTLSTDTATTASLSVTDDEIFQVAYGGYGTAQEW